MKTDESSGRRSVLLLVRYGEVALKGGNKSFFIGRLSENIARQLGDTPARVSSRNGRVYVAVRPEDAPRAEEVLSRVMGIVGYGPALEAEKEITALEEAGVRVAETLLPLGQHFKIEARRTDKSFPLSSYQIACRLGDVLRSRIPGLQVRLNDPDWILNVEIRERAYLYGPGRRGPGGLPVGTSGRGLLLLSGGIDSPVAGYLMARRGLRVDSVTFHTPPFTSEKALEKVKDLAAVLGRFQPAGTLHVVRFTAVQARIRERAPEKAHTLLARAAMMRIADMLAGRSRTSCLITGECLGQVASQTVQSMAFTQSTARLPVFRPLIGWDKTEIIALAREIGTYETSILPYPDCCAVFAPEHPMTRPKMAEIKEMYRALELEDLLKQTVSETERLAAADLPLPWSNDHPLDRPAARSYDLPERKMDAMKVLNIPVILQPDEEGYVVTCPVIPGCYSQGDTVDEALENIREAIELCLEEMDERGEEMPDVSRCLSSSVTIIR